MPAFANFSRTYIGDSELYKTLASLLNSRKPRDPKAEWSFDSLEQRESAKRSLSTTFGQSKPPRVVPVSITQPGDDTTKSELNNIADNGPQE